MKISVVIPTLNEEPQILDTLKHLKGLSDILEVIVVDGGSTDNTVSTASALATVLRSKPGRAIQMNVGAKKATGDVILFLHADSILPTSATRLILQAFQHPKVVGGGFKIRFDDNSFIFKLISFGSNLRAKSTQIFFGDQGIFARKDTFLEVGGFPEIPIKEDWSLCTLLKAKGKVVQLPASILTSSRRFHKYGTWKTIMLMHKLKLLYLLGVSPATLRQMYPSHSEG